MGNDIYWQILVEHMMLFDDKLHNYKDDKKEKSEALRQTAS